MEEYTLNDKNVCGLNSGNINFGVHLGGVSPPPAVAASKQRETQKVISPF